EPAIHRFAASDEPVVGLLELIAVLGIVEEEREVREEVHIVADAVSRDLRDRVAPRPLPLDRPAVAVRVATVARVERPAPAADASVNRALGHLVGRVPRAAI